MRSSLSLVVPPPPPLRKMTKPLILLASFVLLMLLMLDQVPIPSVVEAAKTTIRDRKKQKQKQQGRVNVVLLGATGNLAKKYLWESLMTLHLNSAVHPERSDKSLQYLHIYPAATRPSSQAQPVTDEAVSAASKKTKEKVCGTDIRCFGRLTRFVQRHIHPYSKLRDGENWNALGQMIDGDIRAAGDSEAGRLFYLSVPPRFYGGIAANIDQVSCIRI